VPDQSLDAEDLKLLTLARSARARTGAAQGAAVRESTGRTYAAATVDLPSLRLPALAAAVAAAASSGATVLEAAAVVGGDDPDGADAFADLAAPRALLVLAAADGTVRSVTAVGGTAGE